jgi:hypothetical protein
MKATLAIPERPHYDSSGQQFVVSLRQIGRKKIGSGNDQNTVCVWVKTFSGVQAYPFTGA